jgi:hypothetical protein
MRAGSFFVYVAAILTLTIGPAALPLAADEPPGCGTEPGGEGNARALHRYWMGPSAFSAEASLRQEGEIAVLDDRGDLVAARNPFDLDGAAVRFTPGGAGYGLARVASAVESPGEPLGLGDDDARAIDLPFAFPFYGVAYRQVFVHADGNLTFGVPDAATSQRDLSRFLAGPPRIAAFFADLSPTRGGGVSVRTSATRVVVVWSDVPGAAQINHNTFQAALFPDGTVELAWGRMESREAVVGLSPGAASDFSVADLKAASPAQAQGAIAERFSENEQADLVAVARRFYRSHPDLVEQLVIYTTRPLNPAPGTLAFELNVRNDVGGIGLGAMNHAAEWGSASQLASVVYMDSIDPYLRVDGLDLLAHEVGHRWLAYARFQSGTGASSALLGRGLSHWSFFYDTEASVLEGNQIQDDGGGRFETVDFARRYSPLDQYLMGLRRPEDVPTFFYVDEPDDFRPLRPYKASSAPEAGVAFSGRRREVRIQDVLAALGPRVPAVAAAPKSFRLAFVLVADAKAPATPERIAALERIRTRFEPFFRDATEGRGAVDTHLP